MIKVYTRLILICILWIFSGASASAINLEYISSPTNSCAWARVNSIEYISGNNVSKFIGDEFYSSRPHIISDGNTKVQIYRADSGLLSSCTSASNWKRISSYAPGGGQSVVALGTNCTFNKPTNKNKRTVQFVYKVWYYDITSWPSTWNAVYYKNTTALRNGQPTYKLLSNVGVTNFKVHANECLNVELRYCGDGILEPGNGETCDPGDPTRRGWGNGGCSTNTCTPITTPACNSLTVDKVAGETPTNVVATCSGYKVNTFTINCGNWQVFTGNGNNGGNQTFTRTCNYTTAGNFTPKCFINGSISNNSCQKTVRITDPQPSIIVDKRDANVFDLDGNVGNDTQSVYKWEKAVFQITVRNNGAETLKSIKLIDAVETSCGTKAGTNVNLLWKTFVNGVNQNVGITFGGLGDHSNSTLEVGEYFVYTCEKANTQSNYTNTVTSTGIGVTSGTSVSDSDPTQVISVALPIPEISVDKRDANAQDLDGNIGGNDSQTVWLTNPAVFRITVENTWQEGLRDIKLNDPISASCASNGSVNLVAKTFVSEAGNTVTISVSWAGTHTDDILQVGEKFTYTCEKANTQEAYTNIVDVVGTGIISKKIDTDSDPTEVILERQPSIQVIKEDANSNDRDGIQFNDTQTVVVWDEAIFHITVKNTGNEDLKDLTLTDVQANACGTKVGTTIDLAGATFVNGSDVNVVLNYLTNSQGDHSDDIFQVWEEFSYTCSAPNTQSNYINIVSVDGIWVISGTQVTDEDPSVVIVESGVYDLALRKTLSNTTPGPFEVGDSVTFDIEVFNQGNIDASNIEVTDYIPTGLTLAAGNGWTASGSTAVRTITSIVAGWSQLVTISFTIDANASNSLINYAEISADDGNDCDSTPDSINGNGTGETLPTGMIDNDIGTGCDTGGDEDDHDLETITLTADPEPSIKIEKLDANDALDQDGNIGNDSQRVNKGEKAVFSIRVTNDGTENLNTLVLTDARAPNCAGSITLPSTTPSSWIGFTTGGNGDHTNAVLEPGEYFEYTCEKDDTQSDYTNTAGVTAVGVDSGISVNDSDTSLVDVPGGGSGNPLTCQSASQSGSVVTCKGNSKADSFYLKCGGTIKGPVNSTTVNGQHQATFDCSSDTYQCYVDDDSLPSSNIDDWFDRQAWKTSSACLVSGGGGWSPHCGNGIIETDKGEQCDFGTGKNGVGTNACTASCKIKTVSSDCETTNTCILTWPNGGDMVFGLSAKSIIGHTQNPLDGMPSISLTNNSDYDMAYDGLCVKRTAGHNVLKSWNISGEYCANITGDIIFAYETITLADYSVYPNYTGDKAGIPAGASYEDSTLTATVKVGPIDYYNAYFAEKTNIRVAKPAVVTTGWGTSYVKNTTSGDVEKITGGKSGFTDNTNFVGVSATDDTNSISSNVEALNNSDSEAVANIKDEKDVYEQSVSNVVEDSTLSATSTVYSFSDKYNGLDNVYIVKGKNVEISSIPAGITESTTFIVEWGNLTITGNIETNENVAFVVKGGDIKIRSNVVKLDGTYIAIPNTTGGNITSQPSADQLVVDGSLYGNIENLVQNRYYIAQDGDQLSVGTIVSFGSGLFTRPAPLVSQFVGEYLESEKVAK